MAPKIESAEALKTLAKETSKPWYKKAEVWIGVIANAIAIFGLFFSVVQIKDIKNNQSDRQTDLMFRYDDKLNFGTNAKLFSAIDRNKPILYKNGGKFSEDDLDYFLGLLNQMYESNQNKLLSDDMIQSNFSYLLEKTYKNKEVQDYLKEIRKEDESFFVGFDELAESQISSN